MRRPCAASSIASRRARRDDPAMRVLILFRLVLILAMGITAGPRPAFAVGGEMICGLGAAAYDFERARPALPQPGVNEACDHCIAAQAFVPPSTFLSPEPGALERETPLGPAALIYLRREGSVKFARAPPLKAVI